MTIEFRRLKHIKENRVAYIAIWKDDVIQLSELEASQVEVFVRQNANLSDSEIWNNIKRITSKP